MWRPLRYASALLVGVGVSVAVATVSNQHTLVTVTVAPLYAVTTSLGILAVERGQGVIAGEAQSDRTTATAVGSVGGGVGTALLSVSVPVGVAAYGLLFLGMVSTVLQMSVSRGS